MGDVDARTIKRTQDALGVYVKKPPLTEKLLTRPPFRFLHDICTSLIRSTGIMKGLFTPDEMIADNVKDKDAKLIFLKKVVDYVGAANNRVPSVKVSSIIAGKEADKTNLLLQQLADVVSRGVNNSECVSKVLSSLGDKVSKSDKNEKKSENAQVVKMSAAQDRSRVGDIDRRRENRKKSSGAVRSKEREVVIQSKTHEVTKSIKSEESLKHATLEDVDPQDEKHSLGIVRDDNASPSAGKHIRKQIQPPARRLEIPSTQDDSPKIVDSDVSKTQKLSRPPSAKGVKKPPISSVSPRQVENSEPKKTPIESVKLKTAQPIAEISDTQQVSAGPAAPAISGILMENEVDSDDDNFIVEESVNALSLNPTHVLDTADAFPIDSEQHGGLVNKLLKSKNELAGGNLIQGSAPLSKGSSGLTVFVDEAARKREKLATENEIERLCQALQALTRSALPLGKLVEFLQEDVESMQLEYKEWKQEDQRLQQQLGVMLSQTDSNLDPLREELRQLEQRRLEYRSAIGHVKASIMQNDHQITNILSQAVERA